MHNSHTMSLLKVFVTLLLFLINEQINAQDEFVSPCPRLFVYEGKNNEPDKWYGIVTLLSETDLSGIWLRLIFDRPSLQLGNWFGNVKTTDNKEYLVNNRNFQLKAHVPQTIRFYLKYNPSEPIPKLVSFRLNARTVCPEGVGTETPPTTPELHLSNVLGGDNTTASTPTGGNGGGGGSWNGGGSRPSRPPSSSSQSSGSGSQPSGSGGGTSNFPWNQGTTSGNDDEDFFQGDHFYLVNNKPPLDIDNTDLNSVCGTIVAQPRPLITYGQVTQEGEFPWHAALYHARGIDLAYICGASLVSKNHVLTVAHCVTLRKSQRPLKPENLVVYLGKYYLKRFSSPGIQDKTVSEILPHPQYNPQTYSNDIAVVKFTTPADITDYVRPVCLWQDSSDLTAVLNKQGSVVGWGFDETGKVTEQLMQAKMPVVSQETCIFSFPDFYSRFTSSNTYCAGFRNGTSVCNGDSGGGMVFPKVNQNSNYPPRWQLRGLVSISVALQNQFKCDASHYVVFTDSAKYLDWIKQVMK